MLAGLKLIVSPDLDGFEPARRGAEETLGDVCEALGRVRHVEVVEVVAQVARVRAGLAQVPQLLRRRAPQVFLFNQGLDLYANRSDKKWSLTDCISFIVMKQEALTEALATDDDFAQAGFTALLK